MGALQQCTSRRPGAARPGSALRAAFACSPAPPTGRPETLPQPLPSRGPTTQPTGPPPTNQAHLRLQLQRRLALALRAVHHALQDLHVHAAAKGGGMGGGARAALQAPACRPASIPPPCATSRHLTCSTLTQAAPCQAAALHCSPMPEPPPRPAAPPERGGDLQQEAGRGARLQHRHHGVRLVRRVGDRHGARAQLGAPAGLLARRAVAAWWAGGGAGRGRSPGSKRCRGSVATDPRRLRGGGRPAACSSAGHRAAAAAQVARLGAHVTKSRTRSASRSAAASLSLRPEEGERCVGCASLAHALVVCERASASQLPGRAAPCTPRRAAPHAAHAPRRSVSQKVLRATPSSLVRTTAFWATTSSPLSVQLTTRSRPARGGGRRMSAALAARHRAAALHREPAAAAPRGPHVITLLWWCARRLLPPFSARLIRVPPRRLCPPRQWRRTRVVADLHLQHREALRALVVGGDKGGHAVGARHVLGCGRSAREPSLLLLLPLLLLPRWEAGGCGGSRREPPPLRQGRAAAGSSAAARWAPVEDRRWPEGRRGRGEDEGRASQTHGGCSGGLGGLQAPGNHRMVERICRTQNGTVSRWVGSGTLHAAADAAPTRSQGPFSRPAGRSSCCASPWRACKLQGLA